MKADKASLRTSLNDAIRQLKTAKDYLEDDTLDQTEMMDGVGKKVKSVSEDLKDLSDAINRGEDL